MSIISKTTGVLDTLSGSVTTRIALNQMLKEYGKITYVRVNKHLQQMDLTILLHGDSEPIEVRIDNYRLGVENGVTKIMINQAHADKFWLNSLLHNMVVGESFELPPGELTNIMNELLTVQKKGTKKYELLGGYQGASEFYG